MKLGIIYIIILFSLACNTQVNATTMIDGTNRMHLTAGDNDNAETTTTKWTVEVNEKEGASFVAKTLYKRYGGTTQITEDGSIFYIGTFLSQRQADDFCKNVIAPQFPKAKVTSKTLVQ